MRFAPPRVTEPPQRTYGRATFVGVRGASDLPDLGPSTDGQCMKPYQVEAVHWLRSMKNALLADEMALGKTAVSLRARRKRARVVVCCPASVTYEWAKEAAKWRPDFMVTLDEPLRRPHENELLVISYDSLPDPPRGSSKLVLEPMSDVDLIGDEIQMCKNDTAQRTEKFRRLAAQCGSCHGLTGTPMVGVPPDLWGVLVSLGLAHVYGSRDRFVKLCGGKEKWMVDRSTGKRRQIGYEWGKISDEVNKILRTVMLRRKRADVLKDLPPSQYIDVPVRAPDDLREFLDRVKDAWDEVGPHDLPPFNLLSEAMVALARSKIEAAVEWTERAAEQFPLLVFSAHRDPVIEVGTRVKGAGYFIGETPDAERERLIGEFKKGKLRVLAMTIKTGGMGLNLQEAGGILFVDREYSPGLNKQAEMRANRPGTKHASIVVARLISNHPLDVRLSQILDTKEVGIEAAVG